MHSPSELFEDVILPGALETRSQLADDLAEMRDQLRKQIARLQELRVKKVEQPGTPSPSDGSEFNDIINVDYLDAFYGTEDTNLHNVDVMTDVSMAPTAFTRYTAAPSATSKASK